MTNITTNDPGRTLPPKLAEFGESLLRIADRAREAQGLEPFGEDMHVFMRAVTSAFAGADDRGSVCVRLFDVARRMGLEVGEDEEAYDADIRAHLEELARWGLAAAGAPAEGAHPLAPVSFSTSEAVTSGSVRGGFEAIRTSAAARRCSSAKNLAK